MRFKNPIDPIGGPVVALSLPPGCWRRSSWPRCTPRRCRRTRSAAAWSTPTTTWIRQIALFNPDLGWLRFVERVTRPDGFGHASGSGGFSAKAFVQIYADHREKYRQGQAPAGFACGVGRAYVAASIANQDVRRAIHHSHNSHRRRPWSSAWTRCRAIGRSASWRWSASCSASPRRSRSLRRCCW